MSNVSSKVPSSKASSKVPSSNEDSNSSKNFLYIFLGCIIVGVIGVVLYYFVFKKNDTNDKKDTNDTNDTTPVPSTTPPQQTPWLGEWILTIGGGWCRFNFESATNVTIVSKLSINNPIETTNTTYTIDSSILTINMNTQNKSAILTYVKSDDSLILKGNTFLQVPEDLKLIRYKPQTKSPTQNQTQDVSYIGTWCSQNLTIQIPSKTSVIFSDATVHNPAGTFTLKLSFILDNIYTFKFLQNGIPFNVLIKYDANQDFLFLGDRLLARCLPK